MWLSPGYWVLVTICIVMQMNENRAHFWSTSVWNQRNSASSTGLAGYGNRRRYFMAHLAEGIGMIAAAFSTKKVAVRLSDFKSNEYPSLIGGHHF